MAISTYKSFLMKGTTSSSSTTWAKLIDIKSFPNLGGAPEQLDVTTLSDAVQVFINGIQNLESLEFSCNYSLADYQTLLALKDETNDYAVWLGGSGSGSTLTPTGAYGKFKFKGQLSVYVNGGEVNQPVGMTVTIAPSTEIELDSSTTSGGEG